MKRPVLLILLALVVGFALGLFCTYGIVTPRQNSALAANSTQAVPERMDLSPISTTTATAAMTALDETDDALLLESAEQVLYAMRDGDYRALSALVHPTQGVLFTPYSTVDPDCNRLLTAQQVAQVAQDQEVYTWGVQDGKGDPIQMTSEAYFARYVFNADYTQAPQVSLDQVLVTGNALENVADAYPDARFVEYHFPGLEQKNHGYDWCSLKLVFEPYLESWYLVGVIHSEWTI